MTINVYNTGTGVTVGERVTNIIVKDWRYRRSEKDISPCHVLDISGENAYVKWLTLTGTVQSEIAFDASVFLINLHDESKLTIKEGGRVIDGIKAHQKSTVVIEKNSRVAAVILEDDATLIIEHDAQRPDVIRGNGKVIDKNNQ